MQQLLLDNCRGAVKDAPLGCRRPPRRATWRSQILSYATLFSVITAVVLAVARDVPILHLLAMPETRLGDWLGLACGTPVVVFASLGYAADRPALPWLLAIAWILALAYFWLIVVGNLRAGR